MQAGKLRTRIEVQQNTTTTNDVGETVSSWETVKTRWASIIPLTGREYMLAVFAQADISHTIQMRYFPDIDQSYRLKYGTRIFEIASVLNLNERNKTLHLQCKELV